ncbi:DUF167 domain-containing protein [Verrucomicrobiaceae bacterium N1E253]|uniref:UPF0235 protein HW115_16520 n=2 Tax=Oceaniferula marina TaxID=2748318 RepID=A0A851GJ76_9BACT|nr:DUF167 domain-containing protein [Oceaniferula marina]
MILRIKATPNAKQNEITGWEDAPMIGPVLRIRIQSPPIDGKANKALTSFLADSLNIPKSKVKLIKGHNSRIKTFEIPDNIKLPGQK